MPKPKPRSHLEIDEEKAKEEAEKLRIRFSALLNTQSAPCHDSGPSESLSTANDRHHRIIGDHEQADSSDDQGKVNQKIYTLEMLQRGRLEYTNARHTKTLEGEPPGIPCTSNIAGF